jgi:GTPase SAR1 family protein
MIEIKKNKTIQLDIPSFTCDLNPIGDHLNIHPVTELLNNYGFLTVIGRPGSGKTSMAISMITQKKPKIYKKCFHHIFILMPAESIKSLKKNPFEKLENIYNELNDSTINEIYHKIKLNSENNEKSLLFCDDMTADLKKSKFVIDTMKKLIYNRRHLKLNIIITAQSYNNIPLDVRKNISSLILFKPPKKELEIIFEELVENKEDLFLEIMKMAYDEKHNFLFINIPTQRMFKNWDELIIHSGDTDSDTDN